MEIEDFWYNTEAESVGGIPTGTKAGQFLFLSAQTSIDLDTGEIIRALIDLPPEARKRFTAYPVIETYYGPIMAQTWTIYQNLAKILAKYGASLKDIVRQRIYLRDIESAGWMEEVMLTFFPDEKPSTLILGVPNRGLHEDIRMWVDAIVLIPQKGGLKKETIYLPELEKVNGPYPQGVKVGQFLFFDGIRGVDTKTGRPVTTFDELGTEGKDLRRTKGLYESGDAEAFKAQYWLSYGHLRKILESQGAGINDLLQVNGFWRHAMRQSADRDYLRAKLWPSTKNAPSQPSFVSYNLSAVREIESIIGGIALLPGKYYKETGGYGATETDAVLATLQKAGPFFISTPLSIVREKRRHIVSFADFTNNGRFLAQSRIDDSQLSMARAWHCYNFWLEKAAEFKASHILHQTVYLIHPSTWPAYENICRVVFNGRVPPTTIVPIDEAQYSWRYQARTPQSLRGERVSPALWEEGERVEIQTLGLTEVGFE